MGYARARAGVTIGAAATLILTGLVAASESVSAGQVRSGQSGDVDRVVGHWTPERIAAAQPRDLVVDGRGLGYLKGEGGSLQPYGHEVAASVTPLRSLPAGSSSGDPVSAEPVPERGKPGGGGTNDNEPPTITGMDPAGGKIGAEREFTATVTDAGSGVKSVSFVVEYPDNSTQSFAANPAGSDVWAVSFSGFTEGGWSWQVVARDNAPKGGNSATSVSVPFTVDLGSGGGGGGGGSTIANAEWTYGGAVQTAAGRIYFEMPANARQKGPWKAYVCSGTVATDSSGDLSVVLTAAHCVYDDENKAFARNVLFIPNQAATTGTRTDTNCGNDPLGCWAPEYGVVDADWTSRTFPDNIPWDYGYYVVPDVGAHSSGVSASAEALDVAAGTLPASFTAPPDPSGLTHALGYSYDHDPEFRYCAEDLSTENPYGDLWLDSCGLSGGSSGGPWVQPMDTDAGSGPVISVNSFGYTTGPGMGGPVLHGNSANCLFDVAEAGSPDPSEVSARGVASNC